MARHTDALLAFNRGIISKFALARVDTKRAAWSAQEQTNWMPRTMGSMMLRPGLGYLSPTNSNAAARHLPFVFAADDKAIIELTNLTMRVRVDDAIITRTARSATVSNGNFDANLGSWNDNDEAGGASVWVAGGYMGLTGSGTAAAIRDQTVTVAVAEYNTEHALHIVIQRGPVVLRVGTGVADDSYINETTLGTGVHSLAFTPAGDFNIRFLTRLNRQVLVDSCVIEGAGDMSLDAPYTEALLDYVRASDDVSQSGSILYVACKTLQQRQIERRATRSWSIVLYQPEDGPFRTENTGPTTITPSAINGNITLTASVALFRPTQVGALWSLSSNGQTVTATATAQNTFSSAIRVTGVGASRVFSVTISGLSGTGSTATLQRSLDSKTGPWTDVVNYVADQAITYNDALDNQIAWYRIGVKTGGYVAGTIIMTLTYAAGSITGVVRITAYNGTTGVDAEVLSDLGGTIATDIWAEGRWSGFRGWPSTVAFQEGRLTWHGKNSFNASESDNFTGFAPNTTESGDAGAIGRSIGPGPVDNIDWALPLARLVLGGDTAEYVVRTNSFDEPMTPSNCNIKVRTTVGSAGVQAVKIDDTGIFVQRGGSRAYEFAMDGQTGDYNATDLTVLAPEVCQPTIVRMDVQYQPDKRVHFVLSDGTAAVMVYDRAEKVLCWIKVETDGLIEDVLVMPQDPGDQEDKVYYTVARVVGGATVRYLEKWAIESECEGAATNKIADSFVTYNQAASSTISGLAHLVGKSVVVWDNGICLHDTAGNIATFTVIGLGTISVTNEGVAYNATVGMVGLAYRARFKSAKLWQSIATLKRVDDIGLSLVNTHHLGLKMGRDFDNMTDLPQIVNGLTIDTDTVHDEVDIVPEPFEGSMDTDSRICLEANAPRPACVRAAKFSGEVNA